MIFPSAEDRAGTPMPRGPLVDVPAPAFPLSASPDATPRAAPPPVLVDDPACGHSFCRRYDALTGSQWTWTKRYLFLKRTIAVDAVVADGFPRRSLALSRLALAVWSLGRMKLEIAILENKQGSSRHGDQHARETRGRGPERHER